MYKRKLVVLLLLPLLVSCFLSVGYSQIVQDTSIISMSGADWSLKVDSALASSVESRNTPYMVSKSVTEKELFLQLNSLADCKSGVVQFKVDMTGLTAYKQLPLSQKEIDEGSFRPKNVENSFACFDSSGKKVLHISASKIVDAKGVEVWLDQDLKDGLLTVYLPKPEVLETLTFPLLLDPTFGYSDVGASQNDSSSTFMRLYKVTAVEAATLTQISVYTINGAINSKVGFYNDSSGQPNYLVEGSSVVQSVADGWTNYTMSASVAAGDYWIGYFSASDTKVMFDASSDPAGYKFCTYPTLPDPMTDFSFENASYSMFVTYTPTPTPTPSPSPSPSPSPTSAPTTSTVDYSVLIVDIVLLGVCFFALLFFNRVPILVYLVGFFAMVIGIYMVVDGAFLLGVGYGWLSFFVVVVGGFTMLLTGLGVRLRR